VRVGPFVQALPLAGVELPARVRLPAAVKLREEVKLPAEVKLQEEVKLRERAWTWRVAPGQSRLGRRVDPGR
jgi:hypothetical protein